RVGRARVHAPVEERGVGSSGRRRAAELALADRRRRLGGGCVVEERLVPDVGAVVGDPVYGRGGFVVAEERGVVGGRCLGGERQLRRLRLLLRRRQQRQLLRAELGVLLTVVVDDTRATARAEREGQRQQRRGLDPLFRASNRHGHLACELY